MNTDDRDVIRFSQRVPELFVAAAMIGLLGFLVYHQQSNSGFFTEKFGGLEMIALYAPILISLTPPVVRALTGRRNTARPFDIATNLSLALGSLWLLIVFPFSFVHLADTLPEGLRFILAWVTDDVGRIPLILQIVIGPVTALLVGWRYLSYRRQTFSHSY